MKLYVDFDDTIVKSSKKVVEFLNKKYNLNKSEKDIKGWGYKSVYKDIKPKDIEDIFASREFFNDLEFMEDVYNVLIKHDINICSKGTKDNISKKKEFIKKNIPFCKEFFGLYFINEFGVDFDKSSVDMHDGVQIDDRYDCLKRTNAKYKILFKNYNNFTWQQIDNNEDIYIANTWKEIDEMLDFWSDKF